MESSKQTIFKSYEIFYENLNVTWDEFLLYGNIFKYYSFKMLLDKSFKEK